MGTAVLGAVSIQLESSTNPGETLILPLTAVGTLSLTTALSTINTGTQPGGGSQAVGFRLHVYVTGNTATGTVTIAGKDQSQALNAITETTVTVAVAGTGNNTLSTGFEFTTNNIYSSVNASGITVSGLTGGSLKIYAIAAPRSLQPAMFDAEEKIPLFSQQEQRGVRSRHTNIQRLNKVVDVTKLEQTFYPDTANWWLPRMAFGYKPAQTTLPASPTVLLAAMTVVSLPASLTTQPNTLGPGSLIQLVTTGSSAVGTISIAGTNIYGQAITEVVQCGMPGAANGNGTFYTQQVFATVNASGVTLGSGLTSGSVALNGLFASVETYTRSTGGAGDTLQSAALEWYSGTDVTVLPFFFLTETTIEGSPEKELKVTAKGQAQNMLAVGDRTTTSMTARARASQIGTVGAFAGSTGSPSTPANGLWEPFDVGISGWQTAWYSDPLSGTAGTTAFTAQVLDYKLIFKTPQKASFPAVNLQWFQKVYLQQDECEIDLTLDLTDLGEYENFRQNVERLFQFQIIGPYIGTTGGVAYNKLWKFTFPVRITEAKRDASKMEKTELIVKAIPFYDVTLGYEYSVVIQSQLPPNYAS